MSHVSIWRTLKRDNRHAYHYTKVQRLLPRDYPARLEFCEDMLGNVDADDTFLDSILWTDEATYNGTEIFNTRNNIYWAEENPHLFVENKSIQERWSINKWAGLLNNQLVWNLAPRF